MLLKIVFFSFFFFSSRRRHTRCSRDWSSDVCSSDLVAIKGPLTTPVGGGIRSLNVTLRQLLDLYACIRPVRYFEGVRSEEHTSELQSRLHLVCRLLLEKKKNTSAL